MIDTIDDLVTYLGIGFMMAVILHQDFGVAVSEFAVVIAKLMGPVAASYFVLSLVIVVIVLRFAKIWMVWKEARRH